MFTKWPLAFPVPDQKAERIAKLLCEEVVPLFGVPEALPTDRGANLLSHLMLDVWAMLGIEKLNTTAYHPKCDGMVERFNCTLKTMLRKRAAQFGEQWNKHLAAVLWANRNTPQDNQRKTVISIVWLGLQVPNGSCIRTTLGSYSHISYRLLRGAHAEPFTGKEVCSGEHS